MTVQVSSHISGGYDDIERIADSQGNQANCSIRDDVSDVIADFSQLVNHPKSIRQFDHMFDMFMRLLGGDKKGAIVDKSGKMFTFSTRKDLTSQSLLIAFRDKDDVSISKDVILRKERSHLSKKRNDLDILDQLKEVFSFKLEPQSISIHTNQQAIPSAKEKILHHVY